MSYIELGFKAVIVLFIKFYIFWDIRLSITNKMQRYAVFFIIVNTLQVSGGFSAHHQGFKTVHTASGTCQACLLLPLAWVGCNNSPTLAVLKGIH
jgi:hypothetical protein